MKRAKKNILLSVIITAVLFYTSVLNVYAEDTASRLGGDDSCGTSITISKSGWTGTSQYAVLVTGSNYPDALCAAPLAKLYEAPILLAGKPEIDTRILDELKRLCVKKVFIIGGTGVISESAEKTLGQMGIDSQRLYGLDRYGTSMSVANYIADQAEQISEVVIATGENYPDALSIAPIAGAKGMPIILSEKSQLSQDTKKFITDRTVTKTYVVGGTGVISEDVLKQLPSPQRLCGDDRFQTNTAVLDFFLNSGDLDFSTSYLATGNNFPDALAGSALAAQSKSPIVLVDKTPSQTTLDFVSSNRLTIKQMIILGGEGALSYKSVEPLLPKIVSIDDIEITVNEGGSFTPPLTVTAKMDNNTSKDVAIVWNPGSVDTNTGMSYNLSGTVKGYSASVNLKLNIMHPIMGKNKISPEQLAKILTDTEPNPRINCTPLELAKLFVEEGQAEGVRGDIAFFQSIKETGWFRFGGIVKPEYNNFSGLGATGAQDPVTGEYLCLKFATPRDGVRAQIQHLKAYASLETLKQDLIDPRFSGVKRGRSPYWEWLGKEENPENANRAPEDRQGWAVPGTTYGHDIISQYCSKTQTNK